MSQDRPSDDRPSRDRPSLERLRDSGQRIAHFELRELLGRGGMGEVWLAHDVMLHRDVALKVLAEDCQLGEDAEARLVREARAASGLDHEGIVRVHQLGNEGGRIFIAMEYVPGKTLSELLEERGSLEPGRVADIVEQVATALGAAHQEGLVHRDIKPDNIVIRDDGRAKILDFGLVHAAVSLHDSMFPPPNEDRPSVEVIIDPQKPPEGGIPAEAYDTQWVLGCTMAADGKHTAAAGTPLYMAPEQIDGREPSAGADQFSLATCAFELLTGRPLRSGQTLTDVLKCPVDEALRRAAPALPARSLPVLERALADDPGARFADVVEFARALRRAISPLSLPPSVRQPIRRRPWLLPVLAALLLAVAGVGWWGTHSAAPSSVTLAIVPGNRVLFAQLYAPLGDYVSKTVGVEVKMRIPESYGAAVDGVVNGEFQLAFLSPKAYVDARRRMPDLVLLGARAYSGTVRYQAMIVAHRDGPSRLDELKGKRICLVDPHSTSGYLVPRRMLTRAGVDPRRDMPEPVMSGDHFKSLRNLQAGRCDAAAVSSMELSDAPRQGIPTDDLKVLAESGPLPPVAFVARADLDEELRDAIKQAMYSAETAGIFDRETELSEQMGSFGAISDSDYDIVRELD